MKKLVAAVALIATPLTYAGSTTVAFVRGTTEAQVESRMMAKVSEINRSHSMSIGGVNCVNPKVYAASTPKKSYRVDRHGELQIQWVGTIKVRCSNDD